MLFPNTHNDNKTIKGHNRGAKSKEYFMLVFGTYEVQDNV